MANKKRKYFIDINEAKEIFNAYGFQVEELDGYTLRIIPEQCVKKFDWYHTQGTLMAKGNGKKPFRLGVYGDAEELANDVSAYAGKLYLKDASKKEVKKAPRKFKKKTICPYCDKKAEWVENKEIYGKNYGKSYMIWLCRDCDAYVGCHKNSRKPLGRLADAKTRNARKLTKNLFIEKCLNGNWKCEKNLKVSAYHWLSSQLGITREQCHFGDFDIEMCRKVYRVLLNISSFNEWKEQW